MANNAGPATIISFVVAGFSTLLAAMCYAELGSRVPRAGSAYTYIYVTIGEFVAFIMGWDLILEYIIGTASIASSLSQNIDFFFNNKIHDTFNQNLAIHVTGIASSPDFLAFGLCIFTTRESSFVFFRFLSTVFYRVALNYFPFNLSKY